MVILQKRFIKNIWRDRKSTYVIYIFFVYFCNYLISSFNHFKRGVKAINHVQTASQILQPIIILS